MTLRRGRILLIVEVALGLGLAGRGPGLGAEAPQARLSAEQLRTILRDAQGRLQSLHVAYRSEEFPLPFPPGTYSYRLFEMKSPCFLHHISGHAHQRMEWRDDPRLQCTYVLADRWRTEYPVNRAYCEGTLKPDDPLPGSMPYEVYLLATGVWPLEGRPAPRREGMPVMLRDVAKDDKYCEVRPVQELVEGRWCHVLARPGVDCLWLDIERGGVIMAREEYDVKTGALGQRSELSGHCELAPGLWLPTRIRTVQFDSSSARPAQRQRIILDNRYFVHEMSVNDVEDRVFQFPSRPGAVLIQGDTCVQAEPGGTDQLDQLVGWACRQELAAKSHVRLGWLVGLPAILLVVVVEFRRRSASRTWSGGQQDR